MAEGEQPSMHADEAARQAAWEADRERETAPLPGHDQSHYSSEGQRQAALAGAEAANVARAAGELGMTSQEWYALRKELGRSPRPGDVRHR